MDMDALKRWFATQHYKNPDQLPPLLGLLKPLQWFYGLGVKTRLLAYRWGVLNAFRPLVPVISIGNLTTGGTGKTPIVITLAKGLIAAGKTVVILSRGYGAEDPIPYARALDPSHGDEAYLIQEQVPEAIVIVGKDRGETLRKAMQDYRPDYVLLDDGFQYLKLARDLNIVLIDGHLLLGNEALLPIGPLREPIDQLQRANMVFITKSIAPESLAKVESWISQYPNPQQRVTVLPVPFQPTGLKRAQFERKRETKTEPQEWTGKAVVAFSGIAQPDEFEADLKSLGLTVRAHLRYADHHCYTAADMIRIQAMVQRWESEDPILVTTDKDLTKLRALFPPALGDKLYTLQLHPALDGLWFYEEFLTQLPIQQSYRYGHASSSSY